MDVGYLVQAIDPTCGPWLFGYVTAKRNREVCVKWRNYREAEPTWVAQEMVHLPEKCPQLKTEIKVSQWPFLRGPRNLQKGDSVQYLLADGTCGSTFLLEVNDGFKCEVILFRVQHHPRH